MKKLLLGFIVIISCFFALPLSGQENYSFYIVETLENGESNSCIEPQEICTLNSAIILSESIPTNSVILIYLPYKSIYETEVSVNSIPFYIIKEINAGKSTWKLIPAPLIGNTDINNLNETITDYFLTWNSGFLTSEDNSNFLSSIFFGVFRKIYDSPRQEYDSKQAFFRILGFPQNGLLFERSEDLVSYIGKAQSKNLYFDKIFLNGLYVRIYEESFSRVVLSTLVIVSFLLVFLNLLVFPNLLLYLSILINSRRKTKTVGLVYDSEKNIPLSFAILRLYNITNGVRVFVKQTITDLEGNYYGFPVNRGKYIIEFKHDNYESKEIVQEVFESEGLIVSDIGVAEKRNELKQSNLMSRFKNNIYKNIKTVNKFLVIFNIIIALINILISQNILNVVILSIAIIQVLTYRLIFKKRNWGLVLDSTTMLPIKSAFIKVYDSELNQLNVQLSDDKGRFGLILNRPEYLIYVNAVGYKFPSQKDTNHRVNSATGESFIKVKSIDKRIDTVILLDRI